MNRFAAIVIGLALGAALPSMATAADPAPKAAPVVAAAPFGLEWAVTREAMEAWGIKLVPSSSSEGSQRFTATGLTRLVAGVESVVVDFGFDDKLWKVIAVSEDYPNDPYGFKVKARYSELNDILAQKYGKAKANHEKGAL
jgi:hypothetical protein